MRLDRKMFYYWDNQFDDEVIISLPKNETSKGMADYILMCQEKAKDYDKMNQIIYELLQSKENNHNIVNRLKEKIKDLEDKQKTSYLLGRQGFIIILQTILEDKNE